MLRPSACRLAAHLCLRTQGALSAGRREAGGQEVWVRLSPLPAVARRLPACLPASFLHALAHQASSGLAPTPSAPRSSGFTDKQSAASLALTRVRSLDSEVDTSSPFSPKMFSEHLGAPKNDIVTACRELTAF